MIRLFLSFIALLALAPPALRAAEPGPVVELLLPERSAPLPMAPADLLLAGDAVFVIGALPEGGGMVARLDRFSLEPQARQRFTILPRAVAAVGDGTILVLGDANGRSRLIAMDASLEVTGFLEFEGLLLSPSITVADKARIVISNVSVIRQDGAAQAVFIVDTSDRSALKFAEKAGGALIRQTAVDAWLSPSQGVIFLNGAYDTGLYAYHQDSGARLSDIGSELTRTLRPTPFAIAGITAGTACRVKVGTSFLIADTTQNTLTVVVYDDFVAELFAVARVRESLLPERQSSETFPNTNVAVPTGLIGTSCDRALVLLANADSRQVAQFTWRDALQSLEKVGGFRLPVFPTAVAVEADGSAAYFVSAEGRQILRYGAGAAVEESRDMAPAIGEGVAEDPVRTLRLSGDYDIRTLQRELAARGYKIAIDGQLGPQTRSALDLANAQFGLGLSDTRLTSAAAVAAAIEAIQSVKPLTTKGYTK